MSVFADEALSDDKFLMGRLRLLQPVRGYRAATDPVLLAAACPAVAGQRVLDLGCGAGAAALCLAARVPGVVLAGLEVQPEYADLARRNAARNAVAMEVVEGDLAAMPRVLRRGFDHVIANPPYYAAGGSPSPVAARDRALRVGTPISDWVAAAAQRLEPGGLLTMIFATPCLPEALAALAPKMGSAEVLPLEPRAGRAPPRVILRARKGGRAAFRLLAPFTLHAGAAHGGDREDYTAAANAVLRNGEDLSAAFR
ncbi:methyltransferase [Rhodobacteraceae bacterium HSP-20]|uniref:Methyltransferase n=1 Tax=Paragemmobacter amnigenus TaxID=2852097 RepID=A0ABS6J9A1_9RHOB|nr:methyltransferase [Rhodobacter amnigenus]MBU9699057.1 methyltransferase [Rhodobacter amnigenus]MBV4390284.1 methyltransferase [Rhodobacter amnigenus]